jgi:alpha/beta superfamily hydrolase
MEKRITYTSDGIEIEGLLNQVSDKGVIVTHPHPLYGGDMYNPVVNTIARAFNAHGFTALRFNFRGVGQSQGSYEDGIGERKDVHNAISFLLKMGIQTISLAGYSFGSWVNAGVSEDEPSVVEMIMVSPPVAMMDFSPSSKIPGLKLVVSGERDEIAPPEQIKKMVPAWNPDAMVEILPGTDHFYSGRLDSLATALNTYLCPK